MAMSPYKPLIDAIAWSLLAWVSYRKLEFYFFPRPQGLKRYQRTPRAYALITGASGGIGYGFAQELASHGFGLILMANKKQKLIDAGERLKSEFPGTVVETISFDATSSDYEKLVAALAPYLELPITMLINNVGTVTVRPAFVPLPTYSVSDVVANVNVNITFMTQMTRALLPTLVRNGRSAILHIGSNSSLGTPYISIYSGSNAYIESFATCIAREAVAESWELDSICVSPGEVRSETNNISLAPGTPTSREYAKMTLNRIEMAADRKMRVIMPYWQHALAYILMKDGPERLTQYLYVKTLREKGDAAAKRDAESKKE